MQPTALNAPLVTQKQVPTIEKTPKTVEIAQAWVNAHAERQMPIIQKIQKTVEILQLQFLDEAVDVPGVLRRRVLVIQKWRTEVEVAHPAH